MNPSLSIVLPVRNAEHRLAGQIDQLLDVLPELTRRFEVLVVDDASSDDTCHVAQELSRCYPQVKVVRHPVSLGVVESIQTGVDHCEGEIVLVGDAEYGMPTDDLVKLWALRHDNDVVIARKAPRPSEKRPTFRQLLERSAKGCNKSTRSAELHLIRRNELDDLRLDHPAAARATDRQPQRPNFLGKIKAFALGE